MKGYHFEVTPKQLHSDAMNDDGHDVAAGGGTKYGWQPATEKPERHVPIEWMDSVGNVHSGTYEGVWMLDCGLYIYYEPTLWRYKAEAASDHT